MLYKIVTRCQHAKTGMRSGCKGPDKYVAVLCIPSGVACPEILNRGRLRKLGIEFHHFGEYYSSSTGPKSRFAAAMKEAHEFVNTQCGNQAAC